jgi:AcrR family transcriptional regulator
MADVRETSATAGFTALTRHDRRKMAADEAALHQRRRILEATTELVVERGYGAVSVAEIVARARVSKSAFYREFGGKAEAFGASVEAALEHERERIDAALAAKGAKGLGPALEEVAALIAENETRAKLVFLSTVEVDAAVGRSVREEAGRRHRESMALALGDAGAAQVPKAHLVGLVGGIEEIVYRRLHADEVGRLAEDMKVLGEWAVGYAQALGRGELIGERLLDSLGDPAQEESPAASARLEDWRADLSDPELRRGLDRRERIVRATGQVVLARGYAGLTVGRISEVAGTSNQTFYENFTGKDEAFLAAFDALSLRAFRITAEAVGAGSDPLRGAAEGLVALLGQIARDPIHQRLVFVELSGAGTEPLARAEAMLDAFVGFLELDQLPDGAGEQLPLTVREAIGGGIWSIVRHEIQAGRGSGLVGLAPAIIDFATIPFGTAFGGPGK